uniref:Uncharacterized protein n=1 Tax=Arundo donax TaxID=35708 RepID=A0A0A9GSG8_ARUDO
MKHVKTTVSETCKMQIYMLYFQSETRKVPPILDAARSLKHHSHTTNSQCVLQKK